MPSHHDVVAIHAELGCKESYPHLRYAALTSVLFKSVLLFGPGMVALLGSGPGGGVNCRRGAGIMPHWVDLETAAHPFTWRSATEMRHRIPTCSRVRSRRGVWFCVALQRTFIELEFSDDCLLALVRRCISLLPA